MQSTTYGGFFHFSACSSQNILYFIEQIAKLFLSFVRALDIQMITFIYFDILERLEMVLYIFQNQMQSSAATNWQQTNHINQATLIMASAIR